ncbi:MAG: hypothetical protein HRT40_07930 [Campylobacteraceae bacterium]|nr:hypothetical protein [Campylobacteraceae bacterium]
MALPFIIGLALGASAVIAFNKSDKLKEKVCEVLGKSKEKACEVIGKSKEFATSSVDKSKDLVSDVKNTITATAECIKEKKLVLENTELESHEDNDSLLDLPLKKVKKTKEDK